MFEGSVRDRWVSKKLIGCCMIALSACHQFVAAQEPSFVFLNNVEVEILVESHDLGVVNGEKTEFHYQQEVVAKRIGGLWGVRVLSQVPFDPDIWRADYHAVRGNESIYAYYAMPDKRKPSVDKIGDKFSVSLRSEKAGGEESGRLHLTNFPGGNQEVFAPLGILHRRLVEESFLNKAERSLLEDGSIRFSSRAPEGQFEMIVNAGPKGVPKSISLVQRGSDLNLGRPLSSIKMNGGYIYPAGGIREFRIVIDEIEGGVFESQSYIRKWRVREELNCEGGERVVKELRCEIASIRPAKDSDGENLFFDLSIPLGHPVWVSDSILNYRWNGRWAVPDTLAMREHLPDRSFSRLMLLCFLVGFLIVLGIVLTLVPRWYRAMK